MNEKNNGWTDFSKEKPEDGQNVDVWLPGGGRVADCVYSADNDTFHTGGFGLFPGSGIHWMPVPRGPFDDTAS